MLLYTNSDLTGGTVPPRNWTVGNGTVGLIVTNYSSLTFDLSSDKRATIATIPPYFAVAIPVSPGENIYFTEGTAINSAIAQSNMFLTLSETNSNTPPSQTPLAQVPGYVQNVQGTVSMSGIGQVEIQGVPEVSFAAGQSVDIGTISGPVEIQNAPGNTLNVGGEVTVGNTALNVQNTSGGTLNVAGTVQIGNTPSVQIANTVNANISSGTVNANIQNASLSAQVINASYNPVNTQQPLQQLTNISISDTSIGYLITKNYPLLASGGRLTYINLSITNYTPYPITVTVKNNGNVLASYSFGSAVTQAINLNYLTGIANNGISLSITSEMDNAGQSVTGTGYIMSSS